MAPITRSKAKSSGINISFESLCLPTKSLSKKIQRKIIEKNKDDDIMNKVEELQCSICSFIFQVPYSLQPCKHTFCKECISEWLTRQLTCPLCRREPEVFNQNDKAEKEISMLVSNLSESQQDDLGFTPDVKPKDRFIPSLFDGMTIAEFKNSIALNNKLTAVDAASTSQPQVPQPQIPTSSGSVPFRESTNRNFNFAHQSAQRRPHFRGRFQGRGSHRQPPTHQPNQYGAFINNVNIFRFGMNPHELSVLNNNIASFNNPMSWNLLGTNNHNRITAVPVQPQDPYNLLNSSYTAPNLFTGQTQTTTEIRHLTAATSSFAPANFLNFLPNPLISQGAPQINPILPQPQRQAATISSSNTANTYIPPTQHSQFSATTTNNPTRLCLNPPRPPPATQVNLPTVNLLNAAATLVPQHSGATASHSQFWANAIGGVNLFRPLIPTNPPAAVNVTGPPLVLSEPMPNRRQATDFTQLQLNAQSQLFVHYLG